MITKVIVTALIAFFGFILGILASMLGGNFENWTTNNKAAWIVWVATLLIIGAIWLIHKTK